MVIVDTTAWIDYLGNVNNRQTNWLRSRIGAADPLGLTDIVLCEVLQGIRSDPDLCWGSASISRGSTCGRQRKARTAVAAARSYRRLRQSWAYGDVTDATALIAAFAARAGIGCSTATATSILFRSVFGCASSAPVRRIAFLLGVGYTLSSRRSESRR